MDVITYPCHNFIELKIGDCEATLAMEYQYTGRAPLQIPVFLIFT